ncbi:MAG: hypothetical protein ABSG77_03775 [Candidatus Acidiferrum sp.]
MERHWAAQFSAEILLPIGLWGPGASRGPKITAGKEAGKRLLRSMSRPLKRGRNTREKQPST